MPKKASETPEPVADMVAEYVFTKENAKSATKQASDEYRKRQEQIAKLGLSKSVSDIERDQLPDIALRIIADHGLRILGGEWEIKSAEEATKVGKVWHDIFRLEMGEPTSISSSQDSENPDQRKNRFEELKLEAKRRVEGGLRAIAGDAG
jgi:hypothetical protein